MNTPLLVRLALRWHARYVVNALYRALLARDPDTEGLSTYCAELSRNSDLTGLARSIGSSGEAVETALARNSAPVVTAAFRGLLGRDPDHEGLETYSETLGNNPDLAAFLGDIGHSQEHWERMVRTHADSVVRAIFIALLRREPDAGALIFYSQQLRQTADIAALISTIASAPEHWELLLQTRRDSNQVLRSDDLPALLADVAANPKVWSELAALRFPQPAAVFYAHDQEAWVFIHAQKTGGTSLQNMLTDIFGERRVYREHGDTLYLRSPIELAQYSIFAGHFDYFSVGFIPRRTRRLFTFLREPRQRLLSLYRFLRAHEPGSPASKGRMEIANHLDAVEFFQSVMALAGTDLWNHLTWCVMGRDRWSRYRSELTSLSADELKIKLESIRVEVRARLQEFAFIGLQEDYSHSCERLFELIGARVPHVRHDHSVEMLSADAKYFKYVPRRPLTSLLQQALEPLVQLDDIVYQEGSDIYMRTWNRSPTPDGYRSL